MNDNISLYHQTMFNFLFYHSNNRFDLWSQISIFSLCEKIHLINNLRLYEVGTIDYEFSESKASKIIRSIGFPTCIEELALKMDLIGI
jgi:hypothetical protein